MAKKTKTLEKTSGKPVLSLTDALAERALASQLPAFVAWSKQLAEPLEDLTWIADLLLDVFKNYARVAPRLDPTNLDVGLTAELLESAEEFDPEMGDMVSVAVNTYLLFLSDTLAWTGTQADLLKLLAMTDALDENLLKPATLSPLSIPELTPGEANAAVADLPFVRRAAALQSWVASGRALTSTGLLRRSDIAEAAACVGLNAVGTATTGMPSQDPDTPARVTSMTSLERLMRYWHALLDADLIVVNRQQTRASTDGQPLLAGMGDVAEDALELAFYLYTDIVFPGGVVDPEDVPQQMAVALLMAAASEAPLEAAPLFAPVDESNPHSHLAVELAGRVQAWADDGLVEVGTHIVVPPVLREPLSEALAVAGELLEEFMAGPPAPSTATYQLKIQVDGITPPVWRRVSVPAEIPLHKLHDVIQRLFAWEDCHLHEFRVGDHRTGTRYAPFDPEAGDWGDPPQDEYRVPLDTILAGPHDKFHYSYDFGDDWDHTITLEKVLPAADPGELPACTGGRGHAPQEDSFGPDGWMEKLEISAVPSHPEHREIRTWLGLRQGQAIDPGAFDQGLVNKRLAGLRVPR